MTDVSFLRKRNSKSEDESKASSDPRVHRFLEDFMNQQESLRDMAATLRDREVALEKCNGALTWKEAELARISKQCHVAHMGFASQKIHFAVALSSALAAKDHAIAAADRCYRESEANNDALYEEGIATIKARYLQAQANNKSAHQQTLAAIRAAYDPFEEAAQAAMNKVNQEMRDAGLDPMDTPTPQTEKPIDPNIAARFSAILDARKPHDEDE
jgi:hypothetical protein